MATWATAQFWEDPRGSQPRFRWPTIIGVLDRRATWVSTLSAHHYAGALYVVDDLRRTRSCTLLVVDGTVADACERLRAGAPVKAEVVYLVTTASAPPLREELEALRRAARAKVAAAVRGDDPAGSTLHLVVELSHAHSLSHALERVHAHAVGPRSLTTIDIRRFADALAERARSLPRALPVELSRELASRLHVAPRTDSGALHGALAHLTQGQFTGETHEATTVGLAAEVVRSLERAGREQVRHRRYRALTAPGMGMGMGMGMGAGAGMGTGAGAAGAGPDPDPDPEPIEGPRHLQARLRAATGKPWSRLVAKKRFVAQVRVGPASADWLGLEQPLPLPATPAPDPRGWPVRVVLWDARYAPAPRVEPMFLPENGATQTISFELAPVAGAPPLAARVTLLFENQVLQTGVLRASVDRDVTFVVDAAPQPVLDRPDTAHWFDAALILNHDDEGTARATVVRDDRVAVVPLRDDGLDTFVGIVDQQLSAIAERPDDYDGLAKKGTIDMLRKLAIRGAALHRVLEHDGALDAAAFASVGPLQVVAARADAFLPVEFLYVGKVPDDDAELCPTAEASLRAGKCLSDCAGRPDRVCPLQFWGLRRVVERHAYRAMNADLAVPFELRRGDVALRKGELKPLHRALVAASDIASKHDANAVTTLLERLAALIDEPPVARANDWAHWEDAATADPSLLVLLPHHEKRAQQDFLHIGADSELLAARIDRKHLGGDTDSVAPIVILMGCETQFTRVQFDDFVSAFRHAGAPIVVATVATILGRHAAPAAARIVEVMRDKLANGPARFGDVMLDVRRTLLADGMPMALGITAYGDADWLIAT